MQESWDQFKNKDVTYDSYRHLLTFVDQIERALQKGKKWAFVTALLPMVEI